ncbi:MAG TPA: nucleotidyl transferase AbiEii/AbiGii toxin family protein [Candidatus Omnitrophota bacterium]|nr:nucleotidyl transferase AbiEii/AbiGii toxin family protein [Candidatus Omnitrophota bacterium]
MKKELKNIEASIKARLKNKAQETNRPFAEVMQYYGMERFLYRFSKSKYADKFILKGALLFAVWQIPDRRTTLDIDFLARFDNEVATIEKVMKDVCETSVDPDGLKFDSQTVKGVKIKEDADYEGVRVKFTGFLDRAEIPMQIDVGFGDIVYPKTKVIDYPVILDFPKPHLNGYPQESVISEKFEAMIKLGLLNSRMKDFYDIWLMTRQFEFKGASIASAIKKTFNNRKTDIPNDKPLFADEIYDEKSDRQTLWNAFVKKGDIQHAPETLSATAKEIERFLIEPVIAISENVAFDKTWTSPKGWE